MKRIGLSLFSIVLALVMLVACGPAKVTPTETVAATDTAAPTETVASIDPVTLTLFAISVSTAEPNGIHKNPVAQYIQDKLGISMDVTNAGEQASAVEKVNAMIASNDLPDICVMPDRASIPNAIKSGALMPLDDLLKYAPNTTSEKLGQAMLLNTKLLWGKEDGKTWVYGLRKGTPNLGTGPLVGNYIRWDLYKKAGYPELKNDDDLLNALAQMIKLEPTTKDGKKVYAMGMFFDWGNNFLFMYKNHFSEGYQYMNVPGIFFDMATQSLTPLYAVTDKNNHLWRTVRFYNKAKQMGLIDPDSYTGKYESFFQKAKDGQYLYLQPGFIINEVNTIFKNAGETEKEFVSLPPINDAQSWDLFDQEALGQIQYAISANCKHPDRAMQLLDWIGSYEGSYIMYNGPEGTLWNMADEKRVINSSAAFDKNLVRDDAFKLKTGAGFYSGGMAGYMDAAIYPETGDTVDIKVSTTSPSRQPSIMQQDMLAHYGAESLTELYTRNLKESTNSNVVAGSAGELPADLKVQATDAGSFETDYVLKALLAKSDEEYDKIVAECAEGLKKYPIDKIFEFYNKSITEGKTRFQEVLDILK